MSMDSADDIELAEDFIVTAIHALAALIEVIEEGPYPEDAAARSCVDTARSVIAGWEVYCRPTCGDVDDPGSCVEATCGCPCHAFEVWDEIMERWMPPGLFDGDGPYGRPTETVKVTKDRL